MVRTSVFFSAVLAALFVHATSAEAAPRRIVSTNLCTDQLLMLLVEPGRIASVSHLARNPRLSAMAKTAQHLRLNHGLAEEVMQFDPDLVLAGAFTTRPTVFILRKLGYRVVELPVASSLNDIRANIRTVAAAVGEPARGEDLITAFDQRLAPLLTTKVRKRPVAALYFANGYTTGIGTLAATVVETAGFRNLAVELRLSGTAQLPLETLLASDPDVLVMGQARDESALAHEALRHPALKYAFANRPIIRIPDRLWVCGTPFVAEAIERLAVFRERMVPTTRLRNERR